MTKLAIPECPSSGLRVTTVGTGTCVPRLERRGPCTLIRAGGVALAVDLGLGSLRGLLRMGLGHADLDALFFTHFHPDHTAELVSFLFAANYDEVPRERPLTIVGGPGLGRFLDALETAYGSWLAPARYERSVRELCAGLGMRLGPVLCSAGAVRHTDSSLAYRIECDGRTLVISGDTGPSPELEQLAKGADLLVLEASLAPGQASAGHLTAREAGELARRADVTRLVLNHLYPAADAAAPEREVVKGFNGSVVVARDGMELEV